MQQVDLPVGDLGDPRERRADSPPGGAQGGAPHGAPGAGSTVSLARRWVADPLPLLGLVGVAAVALGVLHLVWAPVPWPVPALLGVVAAGLALSGST